MRFSALLGIGSVLGLVLLLGEARPAQAGIIEVLNTGYDNLTNSVLPPYMLDAKYTIRPSVAGTYYPQARDVSGLPSTYVAAPSNSRWDYIVTNPADTGPDFVPIAYFDFVNHVTLTPSQAATAQISGLEAAADNQFYSVAINGTFVWQSSEGGFPIEDFHSLINIGNVGLGDFQSGVNTIEFYVYNQGFNNNTNPSPSALLIVGDVTAATPEPSSLVLFGMGALGLLGRCFRGVRRR